MSSRVESPDSFPILPALLVLTAIAWLILHPSSPISTPAPERVKDHRPAPSLPTEEIETPAVRKTLELGIPDLRIRIDQESAAPEPAPSPEPLPPTVVTASQLARATLMARADVRFPAQRHALEDYLLRTDLSPAERTHFATHFPNPYDIPEHRIAIGFSSSKAFDDMRALDQATLAVATGWRLDPRFRSFSDEVEVITGRLAQSTGNLPEPLLPELDPFTPVPLAASALLPPFVPTAPGPALAMRAGRN